MRLARVGKMPTTAVRDLLVEPLERVGGADLAPVGLGERHVGEQVGLGLGEEFGELREAPRACAKGAPAGAFTGGPSVSRRGTDVVLGGSPAKNRAAYCRPAVMSYCR
jgi:hypothetical protein